MLKVLFLDRDGTLLMEPEETQQVNGLNQMVFLPGVISSLKEFSARGYQFVVVSNQDALGTSSNPRDNYDLINRKMCEVFSGEGVHFMEMFVCPHKLIDNCGCRKPNIGMIDEFLLANTIDKSASVMIGDRETDMQFAKNIGIKGLLLGREQSWPMITRSVLFPDRIAKYQRHTKETDISLRINLDGSGGYDIQTGLKFFDHMLEQLSAHSEFDLFIRCDGDLAIDEHHTIEDVALSLGAAFKQALSDKSSIERFSSSECLVMDESMARVSMDVGRPFLKFDARFNREYVGDFPLEMLEHFFYSFCMSAGVNLHIKITGKNSHHQIESCFKAVARCLKQSVRRTRKGASSTKGAL